MFKIIYIHFFYIILKSDIYSKEDFIFQCKVFHFDLKYAYLHSYKTSLWNYQ